MLISEFFLGDEWFFREAVRSWRWYGSNFCRLLHADTLYRNSCELTWLCGSWERKTIKIHYLTVMLNFGISCSAQALMQVVIGDLPVSAFAITKWQTRSVLLISDDWRLHWLDRNENFLFEKWHRHWFDTTMHNQRAWHCKQVKSNVDFPMYYYRDCRSITDTSTCLMRGTSTVFTSYTK